MNSKEEYIFPPNKKTITSLNTEDPLVCLSPFGPVSNLNCPKSEPYCTCNEKTAKLQPPESEPTDEELLELKKYTSECTKIIEVLEDKWLGIDYSNPKGSYNCFSCSGITLDYRGVTAKEPGFFTVEIGQEPVEDVLPGEGLQLTGSGASFTPSTEKRKYFNYDKRKLFEGGANFPPQETVIGEQNSCENEIIGEYFKYYKEYSKTNATFWNTPPKTPLYRRAQTSLMTTQRIKILVHGNWNIRPGKLIEVGDPNFGGRWMVYKVQRVIMTQKHSMYLFLMRDGVAAYAPGSFAGNSDAGGRGGGGGYGRTTPTGRGAGGLGG